MRVVLEFIKKKWNAIIEYLDENLNQKIHIFI